MVRAYTDKELLQRVKELDSFKDIPSGYWLLGVRSSEDEPNRFDDKIYLFKGKITALIQIGAQIKVWRDGDKDDQSEESLIQQEGFFGINFHPNTYDINAKSTGSLVNGWSAGCQVVNNMEKYRKFINLVPANTSITYCLLNEF